MAKVFLPSESTKREIQDALNKSRHSRGNTGQRGKDGKIDHEEQQAPETYIARTPIEGISALIGDVPGRGLCEIWHIVGAPEDPVLRKMPGVVKNVYNIANVVIEGEIWIPVTRAKSGTWLSLWCCGVEEQSSSSSSESLSADSSSSDQSQESQSSDGGSGDSDGSGGCQPVRVLDDIDITLDLESCTIEKTPIWKYITIENGCIVEV